MRILRVAPWLYPDTKGGGQYHVHALSRDQAAMGHDVTVVTIRHDESLSQVEERDGYTVRRYDSIANPLGNEVSPGVAQYLAIADGFDVIHAHSHYYLSTNMAALKRALGDTPLALTNHGLYSQSAPERVFRWYLKTIGRWTFNQANVVFCYTEADRDRVRELGVSTRIEVIPNGIDIDRFKPEGPESELVDEGDLVVLFVGRLVEGKQPSVAVKAMTSVLGEYPNGMLYFCGDGPLQKKLEDQAETLDIRKHVRFLGQVPYEEMPAVYHGADVMVLPSRAEGVPRAVMESLAMNVPVVSSDLPQVRSAFGDAVTYVMDDADAFGTQLLETLAGDSGSELDSTFGWEQTVAETTAVLERLADVE